MRFRSPRFWGRGLCGRAEASWRRWLRAGAPGASAPVGASFGFPSRAALLEAASRPPVRVASLGRVESPPSGLAAHPAFRLERGTTAGPETEAGLLKLEKHLGGAGPLPRVVLLRDAAVMGDGFFVVCDGVLLTETTYILPDIPGRVAPSLSEPPLDLTGDETTWILAANAARYNYWHWVAQVLPAVLQSVEALRDRGVTRMGLVTGPLVGFQRASLGLLGLDALPRVELPRSRACLCGRLAYSEALSGRAAFVPTAHRRALREALLAASSGAPGLGDRIYVSRADTRLRPMTNEAEVEATLAREGFTVLTPGKLPVPQQVMALHHARVVVGPHGAGLTNVLFCRPEAAMLELMQTSLCNAATASLARTSGATVHLDLFPDDPRARRAKGWAVDVDRMMGTLSRIA